MIVETDSSNLVWTGRILRRVGAGERLMRFGVGVKLSRGFTQINADLRSFAFIRG
jgi:hypothetical protein